MLTHVVIAWWRGCITLCSWLVLGMPVFAAGFTQPDVKRHPDLFLWQDTCNVWVLREGDAALLVAMGDGSVVEHLHEIGVKRVEWLLLTDHHRETLQGAGRLDRNVTKIAAPKAEQELFEQPTKFRKWHPKLGDQYTVYGASYARPPQSPLKVDQWLDGEELFEWRGRKFTCLTTPGHSPGGMSYLLQRNAQTSVFSGGIMHDGARMTNWFDTEWDYGFAKGIDALTASVDRLIGVKPQWVFPTKGPAVSEATEQLQRYRSKLATFRADYLRGYPVESLAKRGRHPAVKETAVPLLVQVTPHLYMFDEKMAGKNFAIIISDSGRGLILDCGLFSPQVLEKLIVDMKQHLGLKQIDACWISHMHGDHFTLAPTLKDAGIKLWTMDTIVDKCEHPRRYDFPALIAAYGDGFDGTKIDRVLRDGEVITWEGYKLHIDWMPGQTEFGNCLWLELDGKRIAFTGDNLFGNPADTEQNGHECVVARNSAIIEEGYLVAAKYLQKLKPDIIMGAHSVLMTEPAAFVDRYREWAERMIGLYKNLLPETDYAYLYDPFWVSAYPYRVDLTEETTQTVQITVRNFRETPQTHRVELRLPPDVMAEPRVLEGTVAPKSRQTFTVKLTLPNRAASAAGVQLIPMDITLNGKRHGELFDFIYQSTEPVEPARPEK